MDLDRSQANNEELRITNEKLRRTLQTIGERTVDERVPPLPVKAPHMPFSQVITETVIPVMSMGPKVTLTGVENLEAHITTFYSQMMLS